MNMVKDDNRRNTNEQVLSEGQYLYCCDTTKGVTVTYTGPKIITITGQEYPVVFNAETRKLRQVNLGDAVQENILVSQGEYVEVINPPKDGKFPRDNSKENVPELKMGEKINIQGPISFALWPQISANVIAGHQLRSNEYLLLRVYDEKSARENWSQAVIKPVEVVTEDESKKVTKAKSGESEAKKVTKAKSDVITGRGTDVNPDEFVVGKLFTIKGKEVSFFIPPDGVEVLIDQETKQYVRQALTLASLQYAILLDESGVKDYHTGPKVVFPKPTEAFVSMKDRNGNLQRIFTPIELNEIQGIHVKVIETYTENGKLFKSGDELFLTGADTPIYFPRHEHSLIRYDGNDKHFAIAVPVGEGRYIMERTTGIINKEIGPKMVLPDPRKAVVIRRVLSNGECDMWYPGNTEAKAYNCQLRELARRAPTTRKGVVSEGEYSRSLTKTKRKSASDSRLVDTGVEAAVSASNSLNKVMPDMAMNLSNVNHDNKMMMPDQFTRGSTYTEPRTITMDTKFEGVPTIGLYNGYAVMVVSKSGNRRVEIGPKTILLDYDESLEVLSFSTGKPKNTDNLMKTVYLKERNNQISDKVFAETGDHVQVSVSMSYRVNFEGDKPEDQEKWFEVDNYIKLLCDHVRSKLKAKIREFSIDEFYSKSTDIVRDALLGDKTEKGRVGLLFDENNMRLNDVEVLGVMISDPQIASKLKESQTFAVESSIEMAKSLKALVVTKNHEDIKRQTLTEIEKTKVKELELQNNEILRTMELMEAGHKKRLSELEKLSEDKTKTDEIEAFLFNNSLGRSVSKAEKEIAIQTSQQALKVALLAEETKAAVNKLDAIGGPICESIVALQNEDTMVKMAQATAINSWMGMDQFVDLFKGSPLEDRVRDIITKSIKPANQKALKA